MTCIEGPISCPFLLVLGLVAGCVRGVEVHWSSVGPHHNSHGSDGSDVRGHPQRQGGGGGGCPLGGRGGAGYPRWAGRPQVLDRHPSPLQSTHRADVTHVAHGHTVGSAHTVHIVRAIRMIDPTAPAADVALTTYSIGLRPSSPRCPLGRRRAPPPPPCCSRPQRLLLHPSQLVEPAHELWPSYLPGPANVDDAEGTPNRKYR